MEEKNNTSNNQQSKGHVFAACGDLRKFAFDAWLISQQVKKKKKYEIFFFLLFELFISIIIQITFHSLFSLNSNPKIAE